METLEQQKIDMPKYISKKLVRARPMNELEAVNLGYARPNDDHHEWREGYYVLFDFESTAEFPAELDRRCRITEGVVRSLIIKKEED